MCSIYGMAFLRGHALEDRDKEAIIYCLRQIMSSAQKAGRRATGVAVVREHDISVFKKPENASLFIDETAFLDMLSKNIVFSGAPGNKFMGNRTLSIIGHCRFPTKGLESNNKNNHPIIADHIVGVHNGQINNDDTLFGVWRGVFKRAAEVDSEIIFRLLAHFTRSPGSSIETALKKTCSLMTGGYACAAVNAKRPYDLYIFRNTNPVRVFYWEKSKVLMFATRASYLVDGLDSVDLGYMDPDDAVEIDVLPESALVVNLYENQYTQFALKRSEVTSNAAKN